MLDIDLGVHALAVLVESVALPVAEADDALLVVVSTKKYFRHNTCRHKSTCTYCP